jgi:hypothetical protein
MGTVFLPAEWYTYVKLSGLMKITLLYTLFVEPNAFMFCI